MAIAADSKKEFLESLLDSPAWAQFVDVVAELNENIFTQVHPMSNGMEEFEYFDSRRVIQGSYLGVNTVIVYRMDCNGAEIEGNGCVLSLDGDSFYPRIIVEGDFYVKFTENRSSLSDFYVKEVGFINDTVDPKGQAGILFSYGSNTTSSLLANRLLSSSPLALKDALDKAGIEHEIEYLYLKTLGSVTTVSKGVREKTIRGATFIEEIDGLYRYISKVELVPQYDYISFNGGSYRVVSRNKENVGLEYVERDLAHLVVRNEGILHSVTNFSGVEVVIRKTMIQTETMLKTNYIIPLSEDELSNNISILVKDVSRSEEASSILNRVKPARSVDVLRGKPSLYIEDRVTIKEEVSL